MEPRWTSSAKMGVGTAVDPRSCVWFTISHGIIDEVYYPRVDQANTRDLGLLVTDGGPAGTGEFFSEEKRQTRSELHALAPGVPAYRLTNTCRDGRYRIVKTVITDPERDAVLQHVRFTPLTGPPAAYRVFALLAPHIGNQGYGNDGWVGDYKGVPMLFARRDNVALALACSVGWSAMSCGYVGTSDGWREVRAHRQLTHRYTDAPNGNIALTGEVDLAAGGHEFVIALAFGTTPAEAGERARISLITPFAHVRDAYVHGWTAFHERGLDLSGVVVGAAAATHQPSSDTESVGAPAASVDLYRVSTAVIRTHEDKRSRGGIIASLSVPWGQAKGDHDLGGYHLVWPRDLVESAGGLLAAGHSESARATLRYLIGTQERDGHWPQNMWLDGTPYWSGVQMDETAFPILLADTLSRMHALAGIDARQMVHRAAGYVLRHGPVTQQDRWEEDGGYSPFTLAVEIAALLAAADFAEEEGDTARSWYLREAADAWNEGIERWTYVSGTELARRVGVEGYYARIAPPEYATASSPAFGYVPIKNRPHDESQVPYDALVSPDALALVRFGLRSPHDPRILNTVHVIDALLRTETRTGPVWHRYNGDGYGEHEDGSPFDGTGVGRGWPLLAGERAHYELAAGNAEAARRLAEVMGAQASDGGMIPEQVWDAPDIPDCELANGRPSGSAMPLAWAHAEYVKLLRSLHDGRVFDLPPQTVERYVRSSTPARITLWCEHNKVRTMTAGRTLRVQTPAPVRVHWSADGWRHAQDVEATTVDVDLYAADLPTTTLEPDVEVWFTLFWVEESRWEGEDFAVLVTPADRSPTCTFPRLATATDDSHAAARR
jgi:glucoamylase